MESEYRNILGKAIEDSEYRHRIIAELSEQEITYEPSGVWVDPGAPGFIGTTCRLTDEELVRAYLLVKLAGPYGYGASSEILEVERVYKPVGRPIGKGGRADILVRQPKKKGGECFLFVECKSPETFDRDFRHIDGQLFRLSLQEQPRPRYLLYYTVDLRSGELRDRVILIDAVAFPSFDSWDAAGQPITDVIPAGYGRPKRKRFANVAVESGQFQPLDKTSTQAVFSRLREEIHNVIWGGGGTNNNEVFTYIVKLILCKIYDEKETVPDGQFQFQRLGDEIEPESPQSLVERLNELYRCAEQTYLALPQASEGPAFDSARLSPGKLAYVVGRLERLSVTENVHKGDLLGEFFEQIVSQDFTQSKGQFFTPTKLVRFMLALCEASGLAGRIMRNERDYHGRPRLPRVMDPSCGSGSFLIEYMKLITEELGTSDVSMTLPSRVREEHDTWFGGRGNSWAREYIFGVENNYDLGLAAKVNMVLHGDGSMNTWIASGLQAFPNYWYEGGSNVLGTPHYNDDGLYAAETNDQFDLVISNPPFSLKMSPDEAKEVRRAFPSLAGALSERVFIERWYQLLRDGGIFCCVLPETILDTSNNTNTRLFLYQFFRIRAIVSLPYDAFRPFTSTKTCIVLAEKRPRKEAKQWEDSWNRVVHSRPKTSTREVFVEVIDRIGWADERIFMAEPASIGYKRRKGLPDLQVKNELYSELDDGTIDMDSMERTVLSSFVANAPLQQSSRLGFWTDLRHIGMRNYLRLDPKYRWLWDYQEGVAHGVACAAKPLRNILRVVRLPKIQKGELDIERKLIDLEYVESRQGLVRDDTPFVDLIGSDKLSFEGCELAISKLEPYLGKVLIEPPVDAIGSTEWVGLCRNGDIPVEFVAYLLMLPDLCEAYRRLQSGKRHARFNPSEFLDLRVQLPEAEQVAQIQQHIRDKRAAIISLRVRPGISHCFFRSLTTFMARGCRLARQSQVWQQKCLPRSPVRFAICDSVMPTNLNSPKSLNLFWARLLGMKH